MNKYQRLTKPSQNDVVKLKEIDEKLDALLKDDETILKVKNPDIVS